MADIKGLLAKYKKIEGERFFEELFQTDEYKKVFEYKSDIVLDIGACAGEFSAYIYPIVQVIYALEPFSGHFLELRENIEEFKLAKIKPFKLALGGKDGVEYLNDSPNRGSKALFRSTDTGNGSEQVEVKTLASFMKDQEIKHVDILKIDIEGREDAVFAAPDFPEVASKIAVIIGEHLGGSHDALTKNGFEKEGIYGANTVYIRK